MKELDAPGSGSIPCHHAAKASRLGTDGRERRLSQPHDVKHLRGPQCRHHVGDRPEPARDVETPGKVGCQVGALRVVGAGERLDIWESGAVLDVEQRPTRAVDRKDIGSAGELVVLIRLVQEHLAAAAAHVCRLHLAHHRVDRIVTSRGRGDRSPAGCSPGHECERRFQSQCDRKARVGAQRSTGSILEALYGRVRDTRAPCHIAERPATTQPGIT